MKDLKYYKENAEEDYITTPISVLRYITELEGKLGISEPEEPLSQADWFQLNFQELHGEYGEDISEPENEENILNDYESYCKNFKK
jgi:hypothetical protein